MNLQEYLDFLKEQRFGNQPPKPVQNPQAARGPNTQKPKVPKQPSNPQAPGQKPPAGQQAQGTPSSYFNYMFWTSNVLKQGEIFRKACYQNNCSQQAAGSTERRLCNDRCDIESCKRIIGLLRASMSKCAQSKDPDKCKQRYATLIPLYQEKLNKISAKFIENKNNRGQAKVG